MLPAAAPGALTASKKVLLALTAGKPVLPAAAWLKLSKQLGAWATPHQLPPQVRKRTLA
jgi:hypothetical protein